MTDAVRKGDDEMDRSGELSIDAAFEELIAPEQKRLDVLEQKRYLSQEI